MKRNRQPLDPKHLKHQSPNALSNLRTKFRHRDRGTFGKVRAG